jgi:hypothetical protein
VFITKRGDWWGFEKRLMVWMLGSENKGGTVWSDRKEKCIAQKNGK